MLTSSTNVLLHHALWGPWAASQAYEASDVVAKTTILGHRRVLRWLSDNIPLYLRHAPIHTAILDMVNRERRRRRWRWSTTTTKLASIQGAMALLPMYATMDGTNGRPVLLRQEPAWAMALRASARRAREEQGRQPKAILGSQVRTVILNPGHAEQLRPPVLADGGAVRGYAATSTGRRQHDNTQRDDTPHSALETRQDSRAQGPVFREHDHPRSMCHCASAYCSLSR